MTYPLDITLTSVHFLFSPVMLRGNSSSHL